MFLARILLILLPFSVSNSEAGTISESLSTLLTPSTKRDVMIELPDTNHAKLLENLPKSGLVGDALATQIFNQLQQQSSKDQAPIIKALTQHGLSHQPFWITNRIQVINADASTLNQIAALQHDFIIREPYTAKIFPVIKSEVSPSSIKTLPKGQNQWGVEKINSPDLWAQNYTGQDIVVGIIDTGVNRNHIALQSNYYGGPYSWYDGVGGHSDAPYDGNRHDTHCAGIAVGTENGIGVAPGAKWMACRGLNDQGSGTEAQLISCGEFMQCPSKTIDSTQTNCTGMPNIISNSWSGNSRDPTWYQSVVNCWKASGIISFFAIGNEGPKCNTTGDPGSQYNLISVGSTTIYDTLSNFSSRGPSKDGRTKPEVSAPGDKIVSADAFNTTGYITFSGTSMATPNVAGAAALLLSANNAYKYADIFRVLTKGSVKPTLTYTIPPSQNSKVCSKTYPELPLVNINYPNNGYGHGRIDVKKAYVLMQSDLIST